jgi:hypothetical protein
MIGERNSMHLWPNPVSEELNILFEYDVKAKLSIFDYLGKQVIRESVSGMLIKSNVSALSWGTYYMSVELNSEVFTEKFVKF